MTVRRTFCWAVSVWLAFGCALAAEAPSNQAVIDEIEGILQKNGAQPNDLLNLDDRLQELPLSKLEETQQSLEQMSQAKLLEAVEDLKRNGQYRPGPDSKPQPGVPRGTTFEFTFENSTIFPGTTRAITVYVPAEYTGEKAACVYVGFDGLNYNVPTVFDNLIFKHEMPVTIAIGVEPGTVGSSRAPQDPRYDRSLEFDGLSGDLGRFVLEEILPAVERRRTPDGREIRLSTNPDDRAAGGGSTGGIAAFTLAWQHPEAFHRVFTSIGTFVGMRGGDQYPVLVRKTEPKPIRIFMQDGSHDELTDFLGEVGDWWLSNQTMLSALEFAGYDVRHVFGEGSHNGSHATAIFPDAMRFLWRDWPRGVEVRHSLNVLLNDISDPQEHWRPVEAGDAIPALEKRPAGYRARDGHGHTYQTRTVSGEVWLIQADGRRHLIDHGLKAPTGIALSPDNLWLVVAEQSSHFGYSYRIRPDGTVDARQRFYWFHGPDGGEGSGARGWAFDRDGHLFAATALGVQVFDRNGRSRAILPLPDGGSAVALAFGGNQLDILYVRSNHDHVFRRMMRIPGVADSARPIVVPKVSPG